MISFFLLLASQKGRFLFYSVYYCETQEVLYRLRKMAVKESEVNFDLDKIHTDVHQDIISSSTPEERVESTDKFNAMLDAYDRYLDEKQKELRQKPVKTKEIVADEDAVVETLKTYYAINKKLQQQIEEGAELSPNDIKLLVSMMSALNGAS